MKETFTVSISRASIVSVSNMDEQAADETMARQVQDDRYVLKNLTEDELKRESGRRIGS